jgi:hypothetical protein
MTTQIIDDFKTRVAAAVTAAASRHGASTREAQALLRELDIDPQAPEPTDEVSAYEREVHQAIRNATRRLGRPDAAEQIIREIGPARQSNFTPAPEPEEQTFTLRGTVTANIEVEVNASSRSEALQVVRDVADAATIEVHDDAVAVVSAEFTSADLR